MPFTICVPVKPQHRRGGGKKWLTQWLGPGSYPGSTEGLLGANILGYSCYVNLQAALDPQTPKNTGNAYFGVVFVCVFKSFLEKASCLLPGMMTSMESFARRKLRHPQSSGLAGLFRVTAQGYVIWPGPRRGWDVWHVDGRLMPPNSPGCSHRCLQGFWLPNAVEEGREVNWVCLQVSACWLEVGV